MNQIEMLDAYLAANIPVMLLGPPGTAKTATVEARARVSGAHLEAVITSTLDPIDVGGYLLPVAGEIVCDPPPWAKRLRAALDRGQRAWLFLDELPNAPPSVKSALLRVVNERRVGALDLTGIRVLAAGNPAETSTAEGDVGPAMANRWAWVDWTVDAPTWIVGALSAWGGVASPEWSRAAGAVCSFISRSPSVLIGKPAGGAYPTPRSWTAVIRVWAAGDVNPASGVARALATGLVGADAAAECHSYMSEADLPDPEALLSGRASLPKRPDRLSCALTAVAAAALMDHPASASRMSRAWELLSGQRYDLVITAAKALLTNSDSIPDAAAALGERIRALAT